ncbi:MAG: autoinducer 2-degrading protein [Chitinophagales bacterium]|jgi:autoinducer 2-degrading protein
MIVRIVKLTFKQEDIPEFLEIFEKQKKFIADFDGCSHLSLLRNKKQANIFFTYSHWQNEEALERYRESDFFRDIWSNVKQLFEDKPLAWSLEKHG